MIYLILMESKMEYFCTYLEKEKRRKIVELMNDWKQVIKTKGKIIFPDDCKQYPAIDYFNSDGFFPGYFSEGNKKILFIGRESRYSSGGDRILSDLNWFEKGSPNASSYWRRILYLAYGIKNEGKFGYEQIPYANEILETMVKSNSYGFAVMNISKYSNDQEDGATANYQLINQFLKDSELDKRNFIREEIELLEPDIIITANLWNGKIDNNELERIIPSSDCCNMRSIKDVANIWDFNLNGKKVKLLDLFHFSCRGSDKDKFYTPTMKLLFKL